MVSEFPPEAYDFAERDERFRADIQAWWRWRNKDDVPIREAFNRLTSIAEFMSLAYYRLAQAGIARDALPRKSAAMSLFIVTKDIGPGFRIHHGHSTWILANRIGSDFLVYHNVTIGNGRSGLPIIGNRVKVCTGAVVYGGITIGDDVKIGPNAVVNFDVPSGKKVFAPRAVIV